MKFEFTKATFGQLLRRASLSVRAFVSARHLLRARCMRGSLQDSCVPLCGRTPLGDRGSFFGRVSCARCYSQQWRIHRLALSCAAVVATQVFALGVCWADETLPEPPGGFKLLPTGMLGEGATGRVWWLKKGSPWMPAREVIKIFGSGEYNYILDAELAKLKACEGLGGPRVNGFGTCQLGADAGRRGIRMQAIVGPAVCGHSHGREQVNADLAKNPELSISLRQIAIKACQQGLPPDDFQYFRLQTPQGMQAIPTDCYNLDLSRVSPEEARLLWNEYYKGYNLSPLTKEDLLTQVTVKPVTTADLMYDPKLGAAEAAEKAAILEEMALLKPGRRPLPPGRGGDLPSRASLLRPGGGAAAAGALITGGTQLLSDVTGLSPQTLAPYQVVAGGGVAYGLGGKPGLVGFGGSLIGGVAAGVGAQQMGFSPNASEQFSVMGGVAGGFGGGVPAGVFNLLGTVGSYCGEGLYRTGKGCMDHGVAPFLYAIGQEYYYKGFWP